MLREETGWMFMKSRGQETEQCLGHMVNMVGARECAASTLCSVLHVRRAFWLLGAEDREGGKSGTGC